MARLPGELSLRHAPRSLGRFVSGQSLPADLGGLAGGVGIWLPVPAIHPAHTGSLRVRRCPGTWEAVLEALGDPMRQWGFPSFVDGETEAQRFNSFTQILNRVAKA